MAKVALSGKTLPEIEEFIQAMGEPAFRARQLHSWIYSKQACSFEQMTNLSITCRQKLASIAQIPLITLSHLQISKDNTRKYLFALPDEQLIEAVLMSFTDRASLSACVSSQVGCAVGCTFCATGYMGFTRNLTAQEIVDQVMCIARESGQRIANVVYMGQGEPLLNIEEVIKSLHLLINSVGIGARHLTVSTSGIVPGIKRLAAEKLPITLALSLHHPDQLTREQIVPIAKKFQLPELMRSLRDYANATGRRVTIEYVLLKGVTDTPEQAHALAELVRDVHCNINLIPYNPTLNAASKMPLYGRPSLAAQMAFKQIAERTGKTVTIRLQRGADIDAACGQLHNKLSSQGPCNNTSCS
ncbi:MAG: 23S rRNA (adenine(2503)-C(2))-methyltransferase RlmN [Candidatus Melainabacteria bacterium]|nr:23S rRNA (adenine(2503)-C(2))-methyltransferase RlmN [Candidatus Melainabacteria bacterium]